MRATIRSASAAVIAAACLGLAACTSGSPTISASGGGTGGQQPAARQGTPASGGTVTVKQGNKVICIMTVANGKGTCKVPAKNFGVGTSQIYASYSGGGKTSKSKPVPMTVTRATTVTALTITPAKVSYADEQAGHLTVKVAGAHGGTPTGTVTVTSGPITVCLIKVSAVAGGGAQGSCALPARKLAAGSRPLTASYPGDHWYVGSGSAAKTLTVLK